MLITADDWSPLAGCYGSPGVHTPRVDRLAARGTVFDHAFCNSPSCAVSRANLLTGKQVHQHGQFGHTHSIHGFRTAPDVVTVPAWLRATQRMSRLIGKNHTAPAEVYPWESRINPPLTPDDYRQRVGEALADPATAFVMVAPIHPHRMAGPDGFGLHRFAEDYHVPPVDPADVIVPGYLPDLPEVRADLANYYRAIGRLDALIGASLDALEESGRGHETLVLVNSDHGLPFLGAKATSFEGGHHCPLIVHRPGQAAGRCRAMVSWLDVAPTVYDWLGVDPPGDLDGRSLLPILETPDPLGWDEVVYSHVFHEVTMYDPYRVLRGRRYKYVRRLVPGLPTPFSSDVFEQMVKTGRWTRGGRPVTAYTQRPGESLYDLEQDPLEIHDRIDDPALAQVAAEMRQRLREIRRREQDPWLILDYRASDPQVTSSEGIPS